MTKFDMDIVGAELNAIQEALHCVLTIEFDEDEQIIKLTADTSDYHQVKYINARFMDYYMVSRVLIKSIARMI